MSSYKFFRFPWAASGDKASIPDTVQIDGSVSYPEGFGVNYELELGVDPSALPVPRPASNQLYYDVTTVLRAWQTDGLPEWVTAAQNGGVAVSYPINAVVRHNQSGTFLVYQSLVATNTAEPGTDPTKWAVVDPFNYATSPDRILKEATFPHIEVTNASSFTSAAGSATGFSNWGTPVGNSDIIAGFNTANSLLTIPTGMGGLWLLHGYANTVSGGQSPAGGHGMRLLRNGALIDANTSPAGNIVQCHTSAMISIADGGTVQLMNFPNDNGINLNFFYFTATRLGRSA